MDISVTVGENIKRYRNNLKISQVVLGEMSDVNPTHLGQIERAEINPTIDTLDKIAAALRVDITNLFEESVRPYSMESHKREEKSGEDVVMQCIAILRKLSPRDRAFALKMLKAFRNYSREREKEGNRS